MYRNGGGLSVPANAAAKLGRQIARRIDLPQTAATGGRMPVPGQRESLVAFAIRPAPPPIGNVRLASNPRWARSVAGRIPSTVWPRTDCGLFRGFFGLAAISY